jgi:hypothetical protein
MITRERIIHGQRYIACGSKNGNYSWSVMLLKKLPDGTLVHLPLFDDTLWSEMEVARWAHYTFAALEIELRHQN